MSYNLVPPWNSNQHTSLLLLCKTFPPNEPFTSAEARMRGVVIPPQQYMSLRRDRFIIRTKRVSSPGGYGRNVGVYVIPATVHERMMRRIEEEE